jgi:hypothetical protein
LRTGTTKRRRLVRRYWASGSPRRRRSQSVRRTVERLWGSRAWWRAVKRTSGSPSSTPGLSPSSIIHSGRPSPVVPIWVRAETRAGNSARIWSRMATVSANVG